MLDGIFTQEYFNGGFSVIHTKTKSILKAIPMPFPERFVTANEQEDPDAQFFLVTDFALRAKLRSQTSEDPDFEGKTLEVVMVSKFMNFILANSNNSVGFAQFHEEYEDLGEAKPSRNDHNFRLEELGFKRNKKTKTVYYNMIDPDAHLDTCKKKKKERFVAAESLTYVAPPDAGKFSSDVNLTGSNL